ncbi:MAG: alpha/beta fold hydrolase, partial [Planctomycetales bacterium]
NGDGRGDVIGTRGWLEAPEDRRRGRWRWRPEFKLHRDCSIPILVLDVDEDGDADLVYGRAHNIGVVWVEQVREGDARRWVRHVIDTSWSQPHSLIAADIDADGKQEVLACKRYLGHDGKDVGEHDPLCAYWYDFLPESRTWKRGVISEGGRVGYGLDPKAADLDGDGDLDVLAAGRSGLYWMENLLVHQGERPKIPVAVLPRYDDHAHLLSRRDANGAEHPVASHADWAIRRAHILAHMQEVMGKLPDSSRRSPLDVKVIEEKETPEYVRKKITYVAEPGDRVPAYLFVPKNPSDKTPAVLCLHQTNRGGKDEPAGLGEGGNANLHYAHELAARGYVCLAPDYPSFGEYHYDFKTQGKDYASGSMKAIWNNLRAVDLLDALPEVDPDRIGCIGHSLGGHNAMFTAAFDQRIRATVSSCGFTGFHDYKGGDLAGWTSDRYMPRIRDVHRNDPNRMPFDFHEVVAAMAPRAFFSNSPIGDGNFDVGGVKKVVASASKVYALLKASDRLQVVHPDCGHDFPQDVREQAYRFLDQHLKR